MLFSRLSNSKNTVILQPPTQIVRRFTVLLTGSTGNLGTYLLDALVCDPQITKIYCLNRSRDAPEKQALTHQARALTSVLDSQRVCFLQADCAADNLGLSIGDYNMLAQDVDIVIHNAWLYRYAFNYSAYAASSRDTIPETELIEWKLARTGYGQSKFVPERLLARACREFSIPVIVVRIGQIAGPVEHGVAGAWPRQEWLPSLVHSCEKLGAVPRDLGPHEAVDWVLVDMTARIIMELVVKTEEKGKKRARFYHVANEATAWKELLPVIKRFMPEGIREVGMGGWVGLLEEAIKEGESEAQVPAVKLWDNFEYIRDRLVRFPRSLVVTLDTKETKTKSSTLAALKRVEPAWMELFMEQWGFERK